MSGMGIVVKEGLNAVVLGHGADLVFASDYDALAARVQAVERDNRTYIDERHELLTKNEALIQQLAEAQRTVAKLEDERDAARTERNNKALLAKIQQDKIAQAEQQVARLRELTMKAIDDEPEMPGEMPDEMYQAVHALDRAGLAEWCRIMVRATKRGITERLEHALRETGAKL